MLLFRWIRFTYYRGILSAAVLLELSIMTDHGWLYIHDSFTVLLYRFSRMDKLIAVALVNL